MYTIQDITYIYLFIYSLYNIYIYIYIYILDVALHCKNPSNVGKIFSEGGDTISVFALDDSHWIRRSCHYWPALEPWRFHEISPSVNPEHQLVTKWLAILGCVKAYQIGCFSWVSKSKRHFFRRTSGMEFHPNDSQPRNPRNRTRRVKKSIMAMQNHSWK